MKQWALFIVHRLHEAGFTALWAGGCVRDMLLNATPHDYDVATNATPNEVRKLFRRTLAVGAQFGVIEVLGDVPGIHVQVATFRSDGTYSDGRHPDSVTYGTAEEDAQRRDFTINGLFFDPLQNQVIDYVNGQADLQAGVLRAIGDPLQRIEEDKLRMLRAVRFVSRLGFTLETTTADAIVVMHQQIRQVSAERITDELKKMLTHPTRLSAMQLLTRLKLMPMLLHDFAWLVEPSKGHDFDYRLLGALPHVVNFPLAWSAVLLDVQRQLRASHPLEKAELQQAYGHEFRLSSAEMAHVQYLILSLEAVRRADQLPWAELKPLLAHAHRDDLLLLYRAGIDSLDWSPIAWNYVQERLRAWSPNDLQPATLVTGEDVAALGIKPGPRFKYLLDAVRTAQLNEELHTRTEALELLSRLTAEQESPQQSP